MKVSLILTCYNEAENISLLLEDVLDQSEIPSEMVVVDAGSNDGTLDILRSFDFQFSERGIALKLIVKPGASIAKGRNVAIQEASGPIIAVTDAGCRLNSDWLELITRPIALETADFVGGFFVPSAPSTFQKVLAALTIGDKPGKDFLPSSRSVAFTKSLWNKVGGYPEWLKWGEDTLFDELCIKAGGRYVIEARAIVKWEVRRTSADVRKQFRRYAYGDGLARRVTPSLLMGPTVYTIALFMAISHNLFWAFFLIIGFAGSWVARRKCIPFKDYPMALYLALVIQFSRTYGFCVGYISSFGRKLT